MGFAASQSTFIPSRRKMLGAIASFGFTISASRPLAAQACPGRLSLSISDSLLQYQGLLDRVESEAISHAGLECAAAYEKCSALLSSLEESLKKLQTRLKAQSRSAEWQEDRDQGTALEQSISLLQAHMGSPLSLRVAGNRLLETALVATLTQISQNCVLDPDGKIQQLIGDMLNEITRQTEASRNAAISQEQWNNHVREIRAILGNCADSIDEASARLTSYLANPSSAPGEIDRVKQSLNTAITALMGLDNVAYFAAAVSPDVDQTRYSAKQTLRGLLEASRDSLHNIVSISHPLASNSLLDYSDGVPQASFDNNSLIGAVTSIVHNDLYFKPSPGSVFQVVQCIAICLPIWANFPGNDPKNHGLRKDLIQSTLEFEVFLRIKRDPDSLVRLADALAGACTPVPKANDGSAIKNG